MTLARRLVPLLLLPLIAGMEALVWYALRAAMGMVMGDSILTGAPGLSGVFGSAALLQVIGAVAGGLLALLVGPWGVLPLAALGLAGALVLFAVLPFGYAWVVLVGAASLCYGALRPGLYGALAVELGRPREGLRQGAFLFAYAWVNAGALVAGVVGIWVLDGLGIRPLVLVLAALGFAAAVLSFVPGALRLADRGASVDAPVGPQRTLTSAALAVVGLVPFTLLSLGGEQVYGRVMDIGWLWLFQLNPLVVLVVAPALGLAAVGVQLGAARALPALYTAGVGMVLMALGFAVALAAGGSSALLAAGIALAAVGEVLAVPTLLSRILGDLPWRLVGLVAGLWFAVGVGVPWAFTTLSAVVPAVSGWAGALTWALVGLTAVVGIGALGAAGALQRAVYAGTEG
ncbi:MAG: hypothetical protein JXX28_14670 [Deltaproteobacteria bacterium]|nr:hypothetical protein [Deltaproteobacteria bacterium]